jgi:hypothetical protein
VCSGKVTVALETRVDCTIFKFDWGDGLGERGKIKKQTAVFLGENSVQAKSALFS